MLNKKLVLGVPLLAAFMILLLTAATARAQGGNCPPGCECYRVDNQFIIECSGNSTSVPPPPGETEQPGPTDEPGDPPDSTPEPTAQSTPAGNYLISDCQVLPPGSYGMNCPGNLYDIVYACGPGYSFCWYVSVTCASCIVPTAPPTTNVNPLPCADVDFSQGDIQCTIGWDRRVSAKIPPVPVSYTPFPRGIVYDPLQFTLPPLITQAWQCSEPLDGWDPLGWAPSADYRHLVFCLRWRQVKHPEPVQDPAPEWAEWYWDERAWGNPKSDLSQTNTATHIYVTSSAEKPSNGLNSLPSYQSLVRTFWVVEWKENWERRIERCVHTGNPSDMCNGRSEEIKEVIWIPEGRDGIADLRYYDSPHFWSDSTLIQTPWGETMNVLPVPVIEVQGVIKKP